MQKTTIDEFKEFTKQSKRKIDFTELLYPSSALSGVALHKRTVVIPNNNEKTSFFIAFSDPKSLNENHLFCGVFIPINTDKSIKIQLHKKNIFDRIKLRNRSQKTGSSRFDTNVVITSEDSSAVKNIFRNHHIQKSILSILKYDERLCISVNEVNIDFAQEFSTRSHIGIYLTQQWITDPVIIEKLFTFAEELKNVMDMQ